MKRYTDSGDYLCKLCERFIHIKGFLLALRGSAQGRGNLPPAFCNAFALGKRNMLLRHQITGKSEQLTHFIVNTGFDGEVFLLTHNVVKLGIELFCTGVYFFKAGIFPFQLFFCFIKRRYIKCLYLRIGISVCICYIALCKLPHLT